MADPTRNFFSSTLVGGYSDSDTELTLATGSGANLPDPSVDGEFNLVIYNESEIFVTTTFDGGSTDTRQDLASTNPEIVRVTARSGDVITVTRAQEGTTASAKASENTYRVILASTKKVFDDINTAIANVNVTNLTGVEELTFDSTGDEEFGLPTGTTAQRPSSPSQGYMRYNTSDGIGVEVYNGNRWVSLGAGFAQLALDVAQLSVTANDAVAENVIPLEVEYLVVAGGGGGGYYYGGGGGAGGYRNSTTGESSGGGQSAEPQLELETSTNYTVTIGAGGAGNPGPSDGQGDDGSNSVFSVISSIGGGGGAGNNTAGNNNGRRGGSGGGAGGTGVGTGGAGTVSQGFDGEDSGVNARAGGGGAGEPGGTNGLNTGGDGLSSSITGSAVTRAGGGAGDSATGSGTGGAGGGGDAGQDGTANTGSGGGGDSGTTGNGGSGVVILRYPSAFTISIGAGLTGSETTDGSEKYAEITAGTGNVSWTQA